MSHPGRLEGKVAIITGAGLGLGEGMVRKFTFEGAKVILFELNGENANKVSQSLPSGTTAVFQGDVTNLSDWESCLKFTLDTFGQLDIVVNNAGVVHRAGPSHQVPESEYERIMKINVSPLYHSAKIIQPYFASRTAHNNQQGGSAGGVFINISSISAPRPRPNLVWYAGSKGAVTAITKGLAAEYAPTGTRVNCICPVAAETGMLANVQGGEDTPAGRATITKAIPLGRFAQPKDIANAAAFLASDEAELITGTELWVDGGRSLN